MGGGGVFMTVFLLGALYHHVMTSLPLFIAFDLKSILSDLSVATPAFFGFYLYRTL